MLLAALVGWLKPRQQEALEYPIEENHILVTGGTLPA
jgi:hypothetical protein